MNATSDDISLISTSTRVMRSANKGRMKSEAFLLFFGQIHAKRFFIFAMFYLIYMSLCLLSITSTSRFIPMGIPGLDGIAASYEKPANEISGNIDMKDPLTSMDIIPQNAPQEINFQLIRSAENIWAYLCLSCVLLAGIGLHLSEKKWRPKSKNFLKRVNPAMFLIPMLLIVLSCGYPIGIWSYRSFLDGLKPCNSIDGTNCKTFFIWMEFLRFVVLPVFLIWAFFFYVFFGCCLGFIFIRQRVNAELKARETAAASFRSFRDKDTLLRRPVAQTVGGIRSRSFSTGRSRSLRATTRGTATRPTLSSIFKEVNDSRHPSTSAHGDYTLNDRIDLEIGREIGTLTRRPLETVIEENESRANSQGSLNNL